MPTDDPVGICVALSRWGDSLALTAGAIRTGAQVTALIVDHQLQKGSTQVAHHAADQPAELGCADALVIPIIVTDEESVGVEAAAREARYAALDMLRAGQPVLLGHTQDDQAGTLLWACSRGSGPRAIAGMLPWDEPWGRPLLVCTAPTPGGLRRTLYKTCGRPAEQRPRLHPRASAPRTAAAAARHRGGDVVPGLARTAQLVRKTRYSWMHRQLPSSTASLQNSPRLNQPASPCLNPAAFACLSSASARH
ncbi:MAG: ATP-binding protein [Lawsonella clevelandensis]